MSGTVTNTAETTRHAFRLEQLEDGVTILYFDLPDEKVNKLTTEVLLELEQVLIRVSKDSSVKALVFMGGKESTGTFIAGADINEIKDVTVAAEATEKARQAQGILHRFSTLPQPTIAVIHGTCLGGGTELVLACDFRVATDHPRTQIGLPEVKLGIIPGFGGTQRLPRIIGVRPALNLILKGSSVDARKATRLGLVDTIVPLTLLREQVLSFTRDVLDKGGKSYRPRRKRKGTVARFLEHTGTGHSIVRHFVSKNLQKTTGGHYPAPEKALEAVLSGFRMSLEDGLNYEARLVGELVASDVSKNLISVFFDSEKLRRPEGEADGEQEVSREARSPHEVPARRIGVLGAGVMGGGLAALLARKNFHVRLKDLHSGALTAGLKQAKKSFDTLVKRRRISASQRDNYLSAIAETTDSSGFRHTECVIEAVVEDMAIKQKVLQELEPLLSENTIFATNTSALSIDELASVAQRPERVAGLHFFNPVHRMPLVEVIYGEKSSEDTLRRLENLAREIGKYPLRVRNTPGFLVNRLLMPYLNEAAFLFEEGYKMTAVDQHAIEFGLPMGPFRLLDEVGLDVSGKVGKFLHRELGERCAPAALLKTLLEEGLLGRKGGAGFYVYSGKKKEKPNGKLAKHGGQGLRTDRPEYWIRRMLYPVVNEAALCLEDKVVQEAWQVDIGMIMGAGFMPFRGGLLRWADRVGLDKIVAELEKLGEENIPGSKERFRPAGLLKDLASQGKGFYY
jgi:3-hydroxyacyl-CoA dehydrogenase/enoyl-CoA hydratase/3-hydroxybutyryl-CoA epimerase